MGKMIDLEFGPTATRAYVAMPSGPGPYPGMVVTCHKGGVDNITQWQADHLALAEFVAIAPDHYHVLPPGTDLEERLKYLTDEQLAKDLQGAADWLVARGNVDAARRGLLGSCMGGRITLMGLSALPDVWSAGVIYYGGNSFKSLKDNLPPPASPERLKRIKAPISAFYGNEDKNPSPEDVNRLDALLTELGKEHYFYRYDGAPHGFQNKFGGRCHDAAAEDSWAKAVDFLGRKLKVKVGA